MFLRFIFLVTMAFLAVILIFGEKVRGEGAPVNMVAIGWTAVDVRVVGAI